MPASSLSRCPGSRRHVTIGKIAGLRRARAARQVLEPGLGLVVAG